ncbi:MAG: YjaG family protein [Thalassotalea sp.]
MIHLPFKQLSHWQQVAFAAAIIERMLPNYQMFAEVEDTGDSKVLRNQLDLVWQWLDKSNRVKINYDAQFIKLEEQTPDPENFDSFGVFPAVDVCMALLSLLQHMQDKDSEGDESVSRLSVNSVAYYCELEFAQLVEGDEEEEIDLKAHPLMQWELATQNEVFDFIKSHDENKKTCQLAKALVLEEGMSNLGIELT